MAVSALTRFVHLRNILNINNGVVSSLANSVQRLYSNLSKSDPTNTQSDNVVATDKGLQVVPKKKMAKAMKAYLERAREYDEFMKKEIAEYQIGKRHLANMMGEDPNSFSDADVSKAIEYLFPSGLYDRKARPMMLPPHIIHPPKKAAEFDATGRPHHSLFYTTRANYFEVLYSIMEWSSKLNKLEDHELQNRSGREPKNKLSLVGSRWLTKEETEKRLIEILKDQHYDYLIQSLERLAEHPLSFYASDFIMQYRILLQRSAEDIDLLPIEHDANGRPYVYVQHCARKSARGSVTVWGNGSGIITINGKDLLQFADIQCREQIIFPLIFAEMADKIDIEATVNGGGPTGQSGAVRWGIAWGLRSFVSKEMRSQMKIAGLLTRDWRRRERKKYGQEGARRKYTWKKR